MNTCAWDGKYNGYNLDVVKCLGPNGNYIEFKHTGKINIDENSDYWSRFFWIKDEDEGNNKKVVQMYNPYSRSEDLKTELTKFFSGYKLPIRLVSKKK